MGPANIETTSNVHRKQDKKVLLTNEPGRGRDVNVFGCYDNSVNVT